MSSIDTIGKLFQKDDVTVVDWKIANFSKLPDKVDTRYISPIFAFSGTCWCLSLFPNGQKNDESEGHIGLDLLKSGNCTCTIDFTLCIKDAKATDSYRWNFQCEFKSRGYGLSELCKRSELMSRGSELFPADILTIRCTMKTLDRCPVRVSYFQRFLNLTGKMMAILTGEKRTDVVLKVKGRNFKAHRAILETGSSVFEAMFSHDMVENRTGEVSIDDVDADIFEQVLCYMYSCRVDDLDANNVFQLYVAADKYDLEDLKELCITFMEDNMTVELFSEVVTLADTYKEKELMKFVKDFFPQNSIGILGSQKWKKFMAESPAFAAQLLESIWKENADKLNDRQAT